MESVGRLDAALSRAVYELFHAAPGVGRVTDAACKALEWSGDGRLWFGLWAVAIGWNRRELGGGGCFELARRLLATGTGGMSPPLSLSLFSLFSLSFALALVLVLVLDLAAVGALKWGVKRGRPGYVRSGGRYRYVVRVDRYSFPSGHASRSMGLGVALGGSPWGLLWSLAVGASRVAGGRHYVGDVVAGWGVGAGVGWAVRCGALAWMVEGG